MRNRPWIVAVVTLAVLIVVTYAHNFLSLLAAYRNLHQASPFYYAESIDKISEAALCVFAAWMVRRVRLRDVFREVGLYAPILPGIAFAVVVSLPMLIGFAVTRSLTPRLEILPLLFLTVLSPFVEEFGMRGFGVMQFRRGTGWPFWIIVWPSAIFFGLSHVDQGQSVQESVDLSFYSAPAECFSLGWSIAGRISGFR